MSCPSFALSALSKADAVPPRLRISRTTSLDPFLSSVKQRQPSADDLLGAIAEQSLRSLVEQDDVSGLVRGDDCVARALEQPGQVLLGLLKFDVGLERVLLGSLALGDVGPGSDQLHRLPGSS